MSHMRKHSKPHPEPPLPKKDKLQREMFYDQEQKCFRYRTVKNPMKHDTFDLKMKLGEQTLIRNQKKYEMQL